MRQLRRRMQRSRQTRECKVRHKRLKIGRILRRQFELQKLKIQG